MRKNMKERPILFNCDIVAAILRGQKTQTRRPIKPPYEVHRRGAQVTLTHPDRYEGRFAPYPCPFGQPGDRLWVRETWAENVPGCEEQGGYSYRADHYHEEGDGPMRIKWRPSIHMPRRAARLILEITEIRMERVQDITEDDAQAEGVEKMPGSNNVYRILMPSYRDGFVKVWNDIYKARGFGWNENPWVWVVRFATWPKAI